MLLLTACGQNMEKATSFKIIFDHYKAREYIMAISLPPGLVGLVLPEGGREILSRVRSICQEELGWSDERWGEEEVRYMEIIRANYSVPLPSL